MLNFRIGFLSSIGRRLPYPCFRERPPGLIQHVLTVLVFCSCPGFHLRLGASRFFPRARILLLGPLAEKKQAYTTTTERKSFGELFWPHRKTFQAGGGYTKPYKNQENHIHHRNLSSVDPIFFCKEKFCTGAGRCPVSFSQLGHLLGSAARSSPTTRVKTGRTAHVLQHRGAHADCLPTPVPFLRFASRVTIYRSLRAQNQKKKKSQKECSLRAQILKNFKILKFSSELEIFKRATHQTPIFVGNSGGQD